MKEVQEVVLEIVRRYGWFSVLTVCATWGTLFGFLFVMALLNRAHSKYKRQQSGDGE